MIGRNTTRIRVALVLILIIVVVAFWYVRDRDHRHDVLVMRSVIDQYTLDKGRSPRSLDEIVNAGYLRRSAATDKRFQKAFLEAVAGEHMNDRR